MLVIFSVTVLFTIRIWGSFASFLRRRYGGKGPGCTKTTCRHQTVLTCCHFEAISLEHFQSQEEGEKKGGYTLRPQLNVNIKLSGDHNFTTWR